MHRRKENLETGKIAKYSIMASAAALRTIVYLGKDQSLLRRGKRRN